MEVRSGSNIIASLSVCCGRCVMKSTAAQFIDLSSFHALMFYSYFGKSYVPKLDLHIFSPKIGYGWKGKTSWRYHT
jgi:hypothetical protein